MSTITVAAWETKRDADSRQVEDALRQAGFEKADAYRYNSASIRVRVIDRKFEGKSPEERDALVELHLATLPERIQAEIVSLFTFAPSELKPKSRKRQALLNAEFEDPSPSML